MRFSIVFVALQVCWCLPVEKSADPPPRSALDFMKQYGYLKADKTTSAALYTEEGLSDVIKTVQRFGALKETGELDNATLKLMTKPRCGNADIIHAKRSKRFILTSGWNKRHITYYVANWSSKLGEEAVARLIGKALNAWGAYGNLKFTRNETPDADIIVSFARGAHNDPFPFDGPGYVLAHAYFPNSGSAISGDIHFDDDENWVHGNPQAVEDGGTDFYSVALHELGHSLGLGHSNDQTSIMFPYYQGGDESTLQLGQDDILAMYQLYIARPIQEPTVPTTTEPTRRTRPLNTRPPNETPRTRPPEQPTRTTYRHPNTRLSTEITNSRTSVATISTTAPSYRTTQTERTRIYPSTDYSSTKTSYVPTRQSTRTTSTTQTPSTISTQTPSTSYPTNRRKTEETRRTTYSRWYTNSPPYRKDHTYNPRTTSLKSNNRFPSTTTVELTTRRDRTRPGSSVTMSRRPYYPPSRYPIGSQSSTQPPEPDICRGNFDSVANLRGEVFIFKDEYIWRLQDRNRRVAGYPVLLRQMFPYLPENIKKIDAAYQRPDGCMVLFTGDLYWVYDGTNFIENSPRYIQDYGIPSGLGGIDAVQTWARNGKTYLYKADRFWRYNETSKTQDPGYPRHISTWRGVPTNIDAAMTWKDGITYFFKDKQYWAFDNHKVEITSDSPRSSTREWLGCY